MKKLNDKECNRAKGVSIATEFDKFKDVLFNEKIIRHKMKRIQSKKHKLGTYKIDEISLSCFDDKRYVLDDETYTLAYFHKDSVTSCKKIQKDYDKKQRLKKIVKKIIVIKKIAKKLHVSNKMIFLSSNVNEVIRAILNFFYSFFTKGFYTHKKHKKHNKKHKDATKQKHKKHKKHKKHISEQSTFFPFDVF